MDKREAEKVGRELNKRYQRKVKELDEYLEEKVEEAENEDAN